MNTTPGRPQDGPRTAPAGTAPGRPRNVPRGPRDAPRRPPGGPKDVSGDILRTPGSSQEPPRTPPGRSQTLAGRPGTGAPEMHPRRSRNGPWMAPGRPQTRPARDLMTTAGQPQDGPRTAPDGSRSPQSALPQRALELFETMLHQGILPDVITYSALISACEKGALPQRALETSWRQCCTKASCPT